MIITMGDFLSLRCLECPFFPLSSSSLLLYAIYSDDSDNCCDRGALRRRCEGNERDSIGASIYCRVEAFVNFVKSSEGLRVQCLRQMGTNQRDFREIFVDLSLLSKQSKLIVQRSFFFSPRERSRNGKSSFFSRQKSGTFLRANAFVSFNPLFLE